MKRLVFLPLALLVMLALLPSAASADYWRKCGNQPQVGVGWYHVKSHNLGCGKARTVAKRFTHGAFLGGSDSGPLGFSCQDRNVGIELARVACRRVQGNRVQLVRFEYGA